jgi:hypothetical protein
MDLSLWKGVRVVGPKRFPVSLLLGYTAEAARNDAWMDVAWTGCS